MKYLIAVSLAGAMLWLAGCASVSKVAVVEPVGPGPAQGSHGSGEGSLVIYSARASADVDINTAEWRWNNDYGKNEFLYEPAHSDYTIYAQNGEVFKRVLNSRNSNDDTPTMVTLPAGSYKVEAEAVDCDSDRVKVLMTVVIKPGQTTLANLEGGWGPTGQYKETEVAKLPCGRVIGWRATETGYAVFQPGSQSN
jgi:major membrane immunogen (membrane-anchored lipoprotein)